MEFLVAGYEILEQKPGIEGIYEQIEIPGRTCYGSINIKNDKKVLFFLIAFFFYIDGVYTIIEMATSYGKDVGINDSSLLLALLMTQIVAFPFSLIFGKLAKYT